MYLLGEWGFELDEWQRSVLTGSLLERPDGLWVAKEVGVEVPRQNGKGELLEARACIGLFLLDERLLIHSAHEFATATEALERMDARIDVNQSLKRLCKPTRRSHGEEGIYRRNGQRLRYRTRTKGSGRGFTADWLAFDEAMFIAEAFHGALMPTISAVANPQLWYTGSAADQESMDHAVVFARVRERAMAGDDDRLAYFGWSAPFDSPDDVPPEAARDPEMWAQANPALGIRIDPEHVALEQRSMSHRTFCVERLGVGDWPSTDGDVESPISPEAWAACVDERSQLEQVRCVTVDVKPDRSSASVAVAGRREDGLAHVEVVDRRNGTGWVPERLADLAARHDIQYIVLDSPPSPAAALLPKLEALGLKVKLLTTRDQAGAFGMMVDAVSDRQVRHIGQPELSDAIRGAAKRPLGDAWAWSRKLSGVDISPLVAVTQALWALESFASPGDYVPDVSEEELAGWWSE